MKKSYVKEGLGGLWKGLNVNIVRCFSINAAELSAYDTVKIYLEKNTRLGDGLKEGEASPVVTQIAGFVAGFSGALCSSPADVLKSKYMNQVKSAAGGKGGASQLDASLWRCVTRTYKEEGIKAFYQGFTPYFVRTSCWAVVMFNSYEILQKLYKNTTSPH